MLTITPNTITTFPGARLTFTVNYNGAPLLLSTLAGARVEVYFPGQAPVVATIHETNNSFSWVVPVTEGEHQVNILVTWADNSEWGKVTIRTNGVMAARFTYQTSLDITPTGVVHADIYNPLGQLVHSTPMTVDGNNYTLIHRPGVDWIEGEYRVAIRDDNGVLDIDSLWIERPSLVSMKTFFDLPMWQRQLIEYLKYELMGDTHELHPGALFTLEEYAKHWRSVIDEINNIIPVTSFSVNGIPSFWSNTVLKGTTLRVFHSLANKSVTIPRWQNISAPIQDESHYQQSWEARYNLLRPEYVEERAYMKAAHLPNATVTVDPFLGLTGGNLAGQSGLALIQRPSWFSGTWGVR